MNSKSPLSTCDVVISQFRGIPLIAFISGIAIIVFLILSYYVHPLYLVGSALLIAPLLYINKTAVLYLYITSYVYTLPLFTFHAELRLDDILFFVLVSVWIVNKALNPERRSFHTKLSRLLLLWLLINGVSIVFNVRSFSSFQLMRSGYFFIRMVEYVFVYFIVSDMLKSERMRITAIRLIWGVTAAVCVIGLYQFFVLSEINITSTLSENHAHIGVFLMLTFFILLGYASHTNNLIEKILLYATLPLMVYISVLSNLRTGLIAFAGGIVIYFLFLKRFIGVVIAVLLISTAITGGSFVTQNMQGVEESTARLENLEQDASLFGRFYIWMSTVNMLQDNPSKLITGVGLAGFSQALRPKTPLLPGVSGGHNNFLHHLAETGIFGLGIFIAILYLLLKTSLKNGWDKSRKDKTLFYGYFCGLMAVVFSCFTQESISVQPALHNFTGYLFLMTAVVFYQTKELTNDKIQ